jgi:hypothetical protein
MITWLRALPATPRNNLSYAFAVNPEKEFSAALDCAEQFPDIEVTENPEEIEDWLDWE